jgi:hypothetical protein
VFNSSINILIYCWKDAKFRALLLASLGIRTLVPGGGGSMSRVRQSSLLLVTMTNATPLDRQLVVIPDFDLEDSFQDQTALDAEQTEMCQL